MSMDRVDRQLGPKVLVAGHRGMVGQALVRRLEREAVEIQTLGRADVDFTDQASTYAALARLRPDVVIVAAAKVGGIHANNTQPQAFLFENLAIAQNLIEGAHRADVDRLLFLGSSCIYPREAPQPIPEEALLTGPLEPTNEWYAIAKIAGLKLAQSYRRSYGRDYISAMPTNLYGPGDNYHPEHSHVPAGLIRRFHEAKMRGDTEAVVWGSGRPRREFIHVDDLADACVFLLKSYSGEVALNVGVGEDISIADFAAEVARVVGFEGRLTFDASLPDGTPRKLLDVGRLTDLGWRASIPLRQGLNGAYMDYMARHAASAAA